MAIVQERYGGVKGSGFVWPQQGYVVTAYHVVTGDKELAVSFDDNSQGIPAVVVKVLRDRDLALLKLSDTSADVEHAPLPVREEKVDGGMKVRAYGIGQGIRQITDWQGNVRDTPVYTTLNRFLTSEARAPARKARFPDLDKEIIACELSVRPGCSGAPVLDENNHVCGIVSGGLEAGLGAVSWIIPADALALLQDAPDLESHEQLEADDVKSKITFSADEFISDVVEEEVSGFRVVRLKTRTLRQLVNSNFDPLGLEGMMRILEARNGSFPDWSDEKFDIYSVAPASAARGMEPALIALPEGVVPSSDDEGSDLAASDKDYPFTWKLKQQTIAPSPGGWIGANEASRFENSLGVLGWSVDPQFSNFSAVPALHGNAVQRRGLLKIVPTPFGPQIVGVAAVTHSGKIGVNGTGKLLSIGMVCQDWKNTSLSGGQEAQKRISLWILSVFASGFGTTEFTAQKSK